MYINFPMKVKTDIGFLFLMPLITVLLASSMLMVNFPGLPPAGTNMPLPLTTFLFGPFFRKPTYMTPICTPEPESSILSD